MSQFQRCSRSFAGCATLLICVLAAGCGGDAGRDPILGTDGSAALAPAVSLVAPDDDAIGVSTSAPGIATTFNIPVAPFSGGASFVVTCAAPCANPTGTVALDSTSTVATFTLAPATSLEPLTRYTVTVTGARSLATDLQQTTPIVWHFITAGLTPDSTRPRVTVTQPATTIPGPTTGAPTNAAVTASFTESMLDTTFVASTFTVTCALPCISPDGDVSYVGSNRTAVFTPTAALDAMTTYTATVTTAATDLSGNALGGNQAALPAASDYVWTFTTGVASPAAAVTVLSTNPDANQMDVCPAATVNATFSARMNPVTIDATTFTLTGPGPALTPVTAASVVLDTTTGRIATFTPQSALTVGATYTATVVGGVAGVKDLAIPANAMVSDLAWDFTVGAVSCAEPVNLASVAPYGTFGGSAGMTNTGILTVINGDIGTIATTNSSITGFHDTAGDIYTQTGANIGTVNGTIYTCTNSTTGPTSASPNPVSCAIATQARLDAQSAYLELAGMPLGADPGGNLASLTLAPGVYTAPAGSFLIEGGDLTLDAQGDANAVWVFQMATTLTVGGPGAAAPQSVILANGAQAKNVFWQVGSAAIINAGGGGTMVGTIISQAGAAFSTLGNTAVVTLEGRALSLGASVTLVNTVVNVPAP